MSATKNVREQILSSLTTSFAKITTSNGYSNTITEITKGLITIKDVTTTPHLCFDLVEEDREPEGIDKTQECTVLMYILVHLKANRGQFSEQGEKMLKDLEKHLRPDTTITSANACQLLSIRQLLTYDIVGNYKTLDLKDCKGTVAVALEIKYISSRTQDLF